MDITGITPHTTILAKIESLKCIIEDIKVSVTRDMKGVSKDGIDAREIGGTVFFQENLILSNLDEIITHNKVTTNQSTDEREERVLHFLEDRVSSEENIMIVLKEKQIIITAVKLEKPKKEAIGYDTGINNTRQNDTKIKEAKMDGWFTPW